MYASTNSVQEGTPSTMVRTVAESWMLDRNVSKGIIFAGALSARFRSWRYAGSSCVTRLCSGASTACAVRRIVREGGTTSVFTCSAQVPASNGMPPRSGNNGKASSTPRVRHPCTSIFLVTPEIPSRLQPDRDGGAGVKEHNGISIVPVLTAHSHS